MRKKIYAILLATALAGSLASGCMTAFASETEAAVSATEAEEALQANETEAETEAKPAGLEPKETTGEPGWEAQYPTIEAQVEQQLRALSGMSKEQVEQYLSSYNNSINYSIRNNADSMKDTSMLTSVDNSTMATVKMLNNWYSVMDICGEFEGIKEYSADCKDNVITFDMLSNYTQAAENGTTVYVKFTYDMNNNVTLMNWELSGGDYEITPWEGLNNDNELEARIAALEERVAALEAQLGGE